MRHVFIGWDAREAVAAAVLKYNLEKLNGDVEVHFLKHKELRKEGLFKRPWLIDESGQLRDLTTEAPMSTEFSFTRFLVPEICRRKGITGPVLFMDCDMLTFEPLKEVFEAAEGQPDRAVLLVKHNHQPKETRKMDGVEQTSYLRKNWSSFMVFNTDHPDNRRLSVDAVNTMDGLALHGIYWTDAIGALPSVWNWLYGEMNEPVPPDVKNIHYTAKNPWMNTFGPTGDEHWSIIWHQWKNRMLLEKSEYLL